MLGIECAQADHRQLKKALGGCSHRTEKSIKSRGL